MDKKPYMVKGFEHDVNDTFIRKLVLRAHT